jgi:hypothetical protein
MRKPDWMSELVISAQSLALLPVFAKTGLGYIRGKSTRDHAEQRHRGTQAIA